MAAAFQLQGIPASVFPSPQPSSRTDAPSDK